MILEHVIEFRSWYVDVTSRFSEEATRGRVVEAFRRHDPERSAFRAAWLDLQRGGRPLRNPNRC